MIKKIRFPAYITLILLLMVGVVILNYTLPFLGAYQYTNKNGILAPILGTFRLSSHPHHITFLELINAPLLGIVTATPIILLTLLLGSFFEILKETKIIDFILTFILVKMRHSKFILFSCLLLFFSTVASTIGFKDELLVFVIPISQLLLRMQIAPIFAIASIFLGACVGIMAAVINPFTVGVIYHFTGQKVFIGLSLRFYVFLILNIIAMAYLFFQLKRYKTKKSLPSFKIFGKFHLIKTTKRIQLTLFALFIGMGIFIKEIMTRTDFVQIGSLFLLIIIIIGVIGGVKQEKLIQAIFRGAAEMIPIGTVIGFIKGISILMTQGQLTDTILYGLEFFTKHAYSSGVLVSIFLFIFFLSFIITSSSGLSYLIAPIVIPIAKSLFIPLQVWVLTFTTAVGLSTLFNPIGAFVHFSLEKVGLSYKQWFRFIFPFVCIIFVGTIILIYLY
jgi:uncharacterized ion transporter superfamily protein YfcC